MRELWKKSVKQRCDIRDCQASERPATQDEADSDSNVQPEAWVVWRFGWVLIASRPEARADGASIDNCSKRAQESQERQSNERQSEQVLGRGRLVRRRCQLRVNIPRHLPRRADMPVGKRTGQSRGGSTAQGA